MWADRKSLRDGFFSCKTENRNANVTGTILGGREVVPRSLILMSNAKTETSRLRENIPMRRLVVSEQNKERDPDQMSPEESSILRLCSELDPSALSRGIEGCSGAVQSSTLRQAQGMLRSSRRKTSGLTALRLAGSFYSARRRTYRHAEHSSDALS
jgi:hypothetical protein